MSISSCSVIELSPHESRCRARFEYVFDDGRIETRGPMNVSNESEANLRMQQLESDVLASVQRQDAEEAVALGLYVAHREASENQVKYQWLREGCDKPEHYQSYSMIKDLLPGLLALGLTDEQYADEFNATIEEVKYIKLYWSWLSARSSHLQNYIDSVGGK